jgi:DNA-binding GntR family transcriptional regulator
MLNLNYQYRWQQFAFHLVNDLVRHPITTLPGIHALGRQYKVSRPTVEHALSHLEELGVIAPAQPGKRRKVKHALSHLEDLGVIAPVQTDKRRNVKRATFEKLLNSSCARNMSLEKR